MFGSDGWAGGTGVICCHELVGSLNALKESVVQIIIMVGKVMSREEVG